MTGWLVPQLPGVTAQDQVVRAFAGAAEEVADTVRDQADAVEHQLDPDLATPGMLAYLAGWLGFGLDLLDDPDFSRPLLRTVGRVYRRRGTRGALAELLTTLTGAIATVTESGGVFGPGEEIGAYDPTVRVELNQIGPLGRERLLAVVARELPIGVSVELVGPISGSSATPAGSERS